MRLASVILFLFFGPSLVGLCLSCGCVERTRTSSHLTRSSTATHAVWLTKSGNKALWTATYRDTYDPHQNRKCFRRGRRKKTHLGDDVDTGTQGKSFALTLSARWPWRNEMRKATKNSCVRVPFVVTCVCRPYDVECRFVYRVLRWLYHRCINFVGSLVL